MSEPSLTPPETCEEDGHLWCYQGTADGFDFYKCARCGEECEQ